MWQTETLLDIIFVTALFTAANKEFEEDIRRAQLFFIFKQNPKCDKSNCQQDNKSCLSTLKNYVSDLPPCDLCPSSEWSMTEVFVSHLRIERCGPKRHFGPCSRKDERRGGRWKNKIVIPKLQSGWMNWDWECHSSLQFWIMQALWSIWQQCWIAFRAMERESMDINLA